MPRTAELLLERVLVPWPAGCSWLNAAIDERLLLAVGLEIGIAVGRPQAGARRDHDEVISVLTLLARRHDGKNSAK